MLKAKLAMVQKDQWGLAVLKPGFSPPATAI